MKTNRFFALGTTLRRSRLTAVAVIILASLGLQAAVPFLAASASAASQLTSRSIQLSSSTPSATGVTYNATFTAASSYTIKGIVIDFCSNDPFVDDTTCTAPSGLALGSSATTSLSGTWTPGSLFSGTGIQLNNSTGVAVTSSSTITVTITGVTNPSSTGTFYARITTWTTTAGATGYTHGAGSYQDYGGVALSTAASISVTAKIMESLSFCVYISTCGDTPSITIGHGANSTLDTTAVDTKTVTFSLSTNSSHGASVNLKGTTLTSGTNTIPAAGASPITFNAGTADFGMYISSAGSMTAVSPYTGGSGSQYGYDTNASTGTTSTYGGQIATSTGPLNNSVTVLTFGATAGATTPAGVYTTTDQLIATGTF